MYGLNYAGAVFNRDYIDVVLDQLGESGWFGHLPFHVHLGGAGKAVSSVVSKSVDSTEISKFISLLVSKEIPHRLFSIPHYDTRVMESFALDGSHLVIHHRPRDMKYQIDFVFFEDQPMWPEGKRIKSIVVVGPHNEARKVYRWLDFWFREHKVFTNHAWREMHARLKHCKVYILGPMGEWIVCHADGSYVGEVTGDLENECFMAKVNGFSQHGVVIDEDTEYHETNGA